MKKCLRIRWLSMVGAGALAVGALPQVARGAVSDSMIVARPGQSPIEQQTIDETLETLSPDAVWTIDHTTVSPALFGHPTILLEPGTGQISDIFGVARDPAGNYYLGFMSDAEGGSTAPGSTWFDTAQAWFGPAGGWLPGGIEGGLGVNGVTGNADPYLNPLLLGLGYHATFTSDVEPVPEPTTIVAGALLLLPFGASTLRIFRKNRIV